MKFNFFSIPLLLFLFQLLCIITFMITFFYLSFHIRDRIAVDIAVGLSKEDPLYSEKKIYLDKSGRGETSVRFPLQVTYHENLICKLSSSSSTTTTTPTTTTTSTISTSFIPLYSSFFFKSFTLHPLSLFLSQIPSFCFFFLFHVLPLFSYLLR